MNIEFMMWSLFSNKLNNLSIDDYYINLILFGVFLVYMFKDSIVLTNFSIYNLIYKPNKLIFESEDKFYDTFDGSYRPLLDYILENYQNEVQCFKQQNFTNYTEENKPNENGSYYVPDQQNCILVSKEKKIYISMYTYKVEKTTNNNDQKSYKQLRVLEMYSYYSTMEALLLFEKEIVSNWNYKMDKKYKENKYIFSLSWEKENLCVKENIWTSSALFDNSFFPNKETIVNQIDYFLNNKEEYTKRGNPYTLGILLYGLPGGGKTRFVKQLLNYTGRHAVEIDLKGDFDFGCLKNILNGQDIGNGIRIPTTEKIFIFEDIDAGTKKLKNREIEEDNIIIIGKEGKEIKHIVENKNTLSTFLNIIDGVNEASGRICVFTTNYYDKIDPAVFRPGRIDIKIKVKKLTIEEVYKMCKEYWKEEFDYNIDDLICSSHDKYTSAMLNGLFKSSASFDQIKEELIDQTPEI